MFEKFVNMQIELKKNILKNYFENYGALINHYLDEADANAAKGNKFMVDYWTQKAFKATEARYKIMYKLGAWSF